MADNSIIEADAILQAADVYREAVRQAEEADALLVEFQEKLDAAEALQIKSKRHATECRQALVELAGKHG